MAAKMFTRLLILFLLVPAVHGREWKDATGRYSVEANLVTFNDEQAVLKRADGKLISIHIKDLSDADREFLVAREAARANEKGELQTWHMKQGWKIVGRVVGYGRKEIVVQRRRGKIYVNDRLIDNLPEIYQQMLLRLVSHFEKVDINTREQFEEWVLKQKGQPRQFIADGVILELENGDEYTIPFIFFSGNDLPVLQSGWERWLAAEEDARRRQQEDFMLQAQAHAYQQDRKADRQIARMQLMLSAVDAGVTDLWEVYLEPRPGFFAPPRYVVVPARVSEAAVQVALANNPNYILVGVRKLN